MKRFGHVTAGSIVKFEVKDTELRLLLAIGRQQRRRQVDHEEGQVDGIGHRGRGHIHEVFQTPRLFGITEIELNLKAQTVIVADVVGGQAQIGAKKPLEN